MKEQKIILSEKELIHIYLYVDELLHNKDIIDIAETLELLDLKELLDSKHIKKIKKSLNRFELRQFNSSGIGASLEIIDNKKKKNKIHTLTDYDHW